MVCKHCGTALATNAIVCPRCGRSVKQTGGVGFWDIAERPQDASGDCAVQKTAERSSVPFAYKIGLLLLAALTLLLIALLLTSRLSAAKTIEDVKAAGEARLLAQAAGYEARIEALQAIEQSAQQTGQRPVLIAHIPTPESKPLDYRSKQGACLFAFTLDESALSFRWEKQSPDGSWEPLLFDSEGIDSRCGLKLEEDELLQVSKLVAVGLTRESAGIYRCIANTDHGSACAEVMLTIQ